MERAAWTDERLDDLSQRMGTGFDRVDRDIRDLRTEMGQRFDALQATMMRFGGAMILCLLGAIVAFSLGGS